MIPKSLKELRALARSRGLKGYSKLSRADLARLLAGNGHRVSTAVKKQKKTPRSKTAATPKSKSYRAPVKSGRDAGKKQLASSTSGTHMAAKPDPMAPVPPELRRLSGDEEQVESAKFATVPQGFIAPSAVAADLGEDIDRLPAMMEPMLCLLPVKPGVLHGYWRIPPDTVLQLPALKLRLGCFVGDTFTIIEEISPPQDRGHWYFHLDESEDFGDVYLQLGRYEPDGRFVTVTRRGIARIPSLYASEHIDRLWWVSEERFRAIYQRAGGFVRGARLGWAASISSPGGAPGVSSSQHAWPAKNNRR